MKAILVANPKRAGKSTLATNLAGYFAHQADRYRRPWSPAVGACLARGAPFTVHRRSPVGISATGSLRVRRPAPRTSSSITPPAAASCLIVCSKPVRRVIVPVQPSLFDILAYVGFLKPCSPKVVRKDEIPVAVVGMRVDARTRAAAELERFLAQYDLPGPRLPARCRLYCRPRRGLTLFDLPPWRVAKDLEQWQPIIDWVEGEA